MEEDWTDVAPAADWPPGTWRVVELDDTRVAVFNVEGEFYAIEDLCSHDFSTLSDGELCGGEIVCPRHAAHFDIRTGEALTPPAYEPVQTFPVRVDDGMVQVRDPRWD